MDWSAVSVFALILGVAAGGAAVAISFLTSRSIGDVKKGVGAREPGFYAALGRKIWISILFGALAGAIQAWQGEAVVTVVWILFMFAQYSNLRAVEKFAAGLSAGADPR